MLLLGHAMQQRVKRAVRSKKKLFYLCSDFDEVLFLSEVKFNFKSQLRHFCSCQIFDFFYIYKKLQLFFSLFENFHFPLVLNFSMNFSQIL